MVLAVTYPWAPASSYLSSQSVTDSRCNPHATPRSSYSRRSPSRRFFLCRSALLCLVLQRHRRLSVPCSRGFSCLSAQFRSPRGVFWSLEFIKLSSKQTHQMGVGRRTGSPPARAGFWKDDQGHRGTGVGSASRHGGGLGRVHPHVRVPGIPLSYRTGCTRRHGGRRGPPTGCALLVLLLLITVRQP